MRKPPIQIQNRSTQITPFSTLAPKFRITLPNLVLPHPKLSVSSKYRHLGNPKRGRLVPTFLLTLGQALNSVPTARFTHFVREPTSSTLSELVGGCAPKPLLSYLGNSYLGSSYLGNSYLGNI